MKLIFVDIDGTIFDNHRQEIPASTIIALKKLRQFGHKVFICSSRAKEEMCVSLAHHSDLFDGYVSACGSMIYIDDKLYHKAIIDKKASKQIIEQFDKMNITYRWLSDDGKCYLNRVDADKMQIFYDLYRYVPSVMQYDGRQLCHILFYVENESMMHDIKYNKDNISIVHIQHTKEVVSKGINKAYGMQVICKYYGLNQVDTIAFGDSYNDIEMIEYAGIGVCMGNGKDQLKYVADYVTDDIADDGFYKACVKLDLIEGE